MSATNSTPAAEPRVFRANIQGEPVVFQALANRPHGKVMMSPEDFDRLSAMPERHLHLLGRGDSEFSGVVASLSPETPLESDPLVCRLIARAKDGEKVVCQDGSALNLTRPNLALLAVDNPPRAASETSLEPSSPPGHRVDVAGLAVVVSEGRRTAATRGGLATGSGYRARSRRTPSRLSQAPT